MKKKVYQWKQNARVSVDAAIAAQEMDRVRSKGPLTPVALLKAAKAKRNPLHKCFEWDDTVAGEKYRVQQAGYLIRSLTVTFTTEPKGNEEPKAITVRPYVSLGRGAGNDETSTYLPIEEVANDEDKHNQLVRKVWNQLLVLQQRYETLHEFKAVWGALDQIKQDVLDSISA